MVKKERKAEKKLRKARKLLQNQTKQLDNLDEELSTVVETQIDALFRAVEKRLGMLDITMSKKLNSIRKKQEHNTAIIESLLDN